jgi:trimethylguanosine synthase
LVRRDPRTHRKVTHPNLQVETTRKLKFSSKIAAHIGESVPKEKTVIIDAFAGVGGNAIAFARSGRWEQVFAIEKDPKTMKCAKHNAKIYGVDKKIVWVTGDCFDVISRRFAGKDNNVIFASPPWGGKNMFYKCTWELR